MFVIINFFKKNLTVISIIFMACFFLKLFNSVHLLPTDDDQYFLHALDKTSLMDFLHERYMTWSGRLPIEALMVETINMDFFWKVMIPASALILAWAVGCLSATELKAPKLVISAVVLLCMCAIDRAVFHDASLWVAGFYNYLLPISVAATSVVIYKKNNILTSFISAILMSYAVSNEQVSVLFFFYSMHLIIKAIRDKNGTFKVFIFTLIPIISSFVWLSSPGNESRFEVEKNFLLEFSNFNLLDKISHGFATYTNHMLSASNYLFIISCTVIAIASLFSKSSSLRKEYVFISILFISLAILFLINRIMSIDFIFNNSESNVLTVVNQGEAQTYVKYFLAMIVAIFLLYFSYISGFFTYALFCTIGGMAVVVMVGLSPAIYAERPRVFFISDVLLILYILKAIKI